MSSKVPPPTAQEDADSLAAGYELMAQAGITTCLHAAARERELAAIATLADRGPLPLARTLRSGSRPRMPPTRAMLARVAELRSPMLGPGSRSTT